MLVDVQMPLNYIQLRAKETSTDEHGEGPDVLWYFWH